MGAIIEDQDKYLYDKRDTNYMLKFGHGQTTLGSKEDTEQLRVDLRENTVEGRERYAKHQQDIKFNVDNKLPESHRLRLMHELKTDEDRLIELHRRHQLTPLHPVEKPLTDLEQAKADLDKAIKQMDEVKRKGEELLGQ